MKGLGWNDYFQKQLESKDINELTAGRVINKSNSQYTITTDDEKFIGTVSGRFSYHANVKSDYPAVGDFVLFKKVDDKRTIIYEILERKSAFVRKMKISGGRKIRNNQIIGGSTEEQVIAANIDVTFIVVGLDYNFNLQRIERYITLVYNSASKPVIILNKADQCEDVDDYIDQVKNIAFGIPIHAVSAVNDINLEAVRQYLKPGKTVVFLGSSGVGKSTLTNKLFHQSKNETKQVSEKTGKGRHTTTSAQLFIHEDGYMIIDTPGLRELQLWGDENLLEDSFHDVVALIKQCKFKDCHHDKEPGCAIKKAIEDGSLSEERFHSYLKQLGEFRTLSKRQREVQRYLNKVRKQNR